MVATDRVVLIRYQRNGAERHGSGLLVGGRHVLTADHCANGTGHRVLVDGDEYPASVLVRSESRDVDLAVLDVSGLPEVAWLRYARVDRTAGNKVQCQAFGFPAWKTDRDGHPLRAQVDGYVPTGEGADPAAAGAVPVLTLRITDQQIRPEVPRGDLDAPRSAWAGMSGAVVVALDDLVIGVVRGHSPAEGVAALTLTPMDAITGLPEEFSAALKARAASEWPLLPEAPARLSRPPWESSLMRDIEARGNIELAALSPDCTRLAVWRNRSGEVFDVADGSVVFEVDRAPGTKFWWRPSSLHITGEPGSPAGRDRPRGPLLCVRIKDTQFVWDVQRRALVSQEHRALPMVAGPAPPPVLADISCVSPDGAFIVSRETAVEIRHEYGAGELGHDQVTIWGGQSLSLLHTYPFRALGDAAASLNTIMIKDENAVRVFDIEDGHIVFKKTAPHARALAISPDGAVLALGSDERRGHVIDTYRTETSEHKNTIYENYEKGMTFNQTGSLLAIGFEDCLVVKDAENGAELLNRTFGEPILCFGFSNPRSLIVVIGDGGARAKMVELRDPVQ